MSRGGGLHDVLAAQVDRVRDRVVAGGRVYEHEIAEVQHAARRVNELYETLELGEFIESLTPWTDKPQFLLVFHSPTDGRRVLKVYGRRRPGEALTQRAWRARGVPTVEVQLSGDEPTSWLVMTPLPSTVVAIADVDTCDVSATLAAEMAVAHLIGLEVLRETPAPTRSSLVTLARALELHLGAVEVALRGHGYRPLPRWRDHCAELTRVPSPTLLHGDLAAANLLRDVGDGRIVVLDSCGYVGPAEFDAARWAARVGGPDRCHQVLEAWLAVGESLDEELCLGLLGLELFMEAGVRELVKEERRRPFGYPDEQTLALLATADACLAGRR